MATFNGSTKASFYAYLRMEIWENWKDTANNYTNVGYKLSLVSSNGWPYASGGSYPWSIKDNGVVKASGTISTYNVPAGGTYQIATGNFNVTHNADGSKWCDFYAEFTSSAHGYIDVYGGMQLATIARASTPTLSASTVDYGGSVTIYTNRASTDFTHNMWASFSGETVIIGNSYTTSASFTVPLSLMHHIPNTTSSWGTIYVDTYSGPTFIGTKTIVLNTTVPASIVPTITTKTQAEAVAGVFANIGGYVQGISKVAATLAGAGTYSSTITGYEITIEGKTYTGASVTSDLLSGSGSSTITYKVTDSRGRTATGTNVITILAYTQPTLTSFSVVRKTGATTTLQVERSGTFSHLTAKNQATMAIYTKLKTVTDWGTAKSSVNSTTGTYGGIIELTGHSDTLSYDVKVVFYDEFTASNPSTQIVSVSTAVVPMSWSKTGIGAGKVWEQGALDVGGDGYVSGNLTVTGTGGNVYHTGKKPTPAEIGAAKAFTLLTGYQGLTLADGTTTDWIRSTANGFIPYASGGNGSSLGTTAWPWKDVHANNMYVGGKNLGATTAITATPAVGVWHYIDKAGGDFHRIQYWKTADNIVHLIGLAYMEGGYRGNGQLIFTLPVGYRPGATVIFTAQSATGESRIDIHPDGTVNMYESSSPDWITLSGIFFNQVN